MATIRYTLALILLASTFACAQTRPAKPLAEYQTRVPEITAAHWTQPPPALPQPGTVTRDSYMQYLLRTYERGGADAAKRAGRANWARQLDYARREAFFSMVQQDPARAALAMQFVRGDYAYRTVGAGAAEPPIFSVVPPAVDAWWWLHDNPAVSTEDRAFVAKWLLLLDQKQAFYEYGAMNRSFGTAVGRAVLAKLFPDDPLAAERRRYADTVWNDWWQTRDTYENNGGYNSLWLGYLATWIEVTGREEVWQDPGVKRLAERCLALVTPLGVVPEYGEAVGWAADPGRWIALFEKWATVYHDGRYKWAAHRLFEYVLAHEKEMDQWNHLGDLTRDALMDAWLVAEDTVAEQPPALGSLVTERHALTWTSREERDRTRYHARLTDRLIPDKLVLRTGWQPGDTYALVDLCPPLGHGAEEVGSVSCLVAQGSVLLTNPGKHIWEHLYHNCFVVQPVDEAPRALKMDELHGLQAQMQISLEDFHAGRGAAYARVHVGRYMGRPVTLDRRLLFLGERGLWVRDTVTADEAVTLRLGPAWQTQAVYGKQGETWANTTWATQPVPAVFELNYMMQWTNRPWDLLLRFLPAAGAKLAVDDVAQVPGGGRLEPVMNSASRRVWYQQTAALQPGHPLHFSTVLLPHAPTDDASALAEGVRALVDTEEATVLEVGGPGEERWAGTNDGGQVLQAGPLTTDARWFTVRRAVDGTLTYWLADATQLQVEGRAIFSAPERRTVEEPAAGPTPPTAK